MPLSQSVATIEHRFTELRAVDVESGDEVGLVRCLTTWSPRSHSYTFRRYDPLSVPLLYLRFANLTVSERAIAKFASKYGYLGVAPDNRLYTPPDASYLVDAEEFDAWAEEIRAVRRAREISELIETRDIAGLKQLVEWDGHEHVLYRKEEDGLTIRQTIASPLVASDVIEHLQPGGYIKPARVLLQKWINDKLQNHVTVRLLWEPQIRNLEEHMFPKTLLGALWLQFARDVIRNRQTRTVSRTCVECGTPFTARSRKAKYCSSRCDKRADRAKKRDSLRE